MIYTTPDMKGFPPSAPVYLLDFAKSDVSMVSDDSRSYTRPPELSHSTPYEDTFDSKQAYIAFAEAAPNLPKPYGWTVVGQIEEGRFLLILPNDENDAFPGPGYYHYKLLVVDVTGGGIVQEYRFDGIE